MPRFCAMHPGIKPLLQSIRVLQHLARPSTPADHAERRAAERQTQSLSQFNRVFRRVEGEVPTVYRDNLHGGAPGPHGFRAIAQAA